MTAEPSGATVIVGGGVIGLSLAYQLAGEGVAVTVVDRGPLGREASWAGAGILTPASGDGAREPIDRLRAASLRLLAEWAERLRDETGIDNGYRRCGALQLAPGEAEAAALERAAAGWRAQGIEVEDLTAADLARREPAVGAVVRAVRLPGEAQLRNPWHLRALAAGCRRREVELLPGRPVTGFDRRGGRVTALRTGDGGGGETIAGERFVVAAGTWSPALLATAGVALAGRPVRGQIVLLDAATPPFGHNLWCGSRYLVARPDGRVLIGSTEDDAGFDARPTAAGVAGLLDLAHRLVPGLAGAVFERAWAGLRPGSPDHLPTLGLAPGHDNLFLATGHFRAGFELSAGTALVMTELIQGRTPSVPLEAFSPHRPAVAGSGAAAAG